MESKGNELKNVPAMPPIIATVYVHEASGWVLQFVNTNATSLRLIWPSGLQTPET
jgi:hypothetical protein